MLFTSVIHSQFHHSLFLFVLYFTVAACARAIWHIYPITGGVEELKNSDVVTTIFMSGMGVGYILGSFLIGKYLNFYD